MKSITRTALLVMGAMLLLLVLASAVYGATASDSVSVGVTINNYISISSPSDVTLSAIAGTGGSSEGTAAWTVTTNNILGYNLSVAASASAAMTSGSNSIADYTPAVAGTPETWSVAAANSEFGFSAEGASTPTATWGTPSTSAGKFRGFNGVTGIQVASKVLNTSGSGEATTVYFKAEVGASHFQPSGSYTATITATATTL